MQKKFKLLATSSSGLESLVARELRNLEIENVSIDDRSRVFFEGNLATIAKANLWLRTADRVKIVVGEFKARTFDELFENVYALPWAELIPFGSQFPVSKAKAVKSTLHNEPSIQSITKKAIVKKLQTTYHRPEGVPIPENGAKFSIEIALHKDMATVLIDTTGDSLFKRGYRSEKGEGAFVDPTCGSGTFTIEAAMLALNMAPGMNRPFAFTAWPWFDEEILKQEKALAKKQIRTDLELDIQGFDIDGKMIEIAKHNALAAGLSDVIKYKQMRLQDFRTDKLDGVLVSNPPYGVRLEDEEAVAALYGEMGKTFAPLETWSKYILTSDVAFEKHYGAKATKKRKLYNGTLRTDLYMYFGKRMK